MNIPIAHSTESIDRFLQHIAAGAAPKAVTPEYLRKAGFTSGNDIELRHIFRILGFLDADGIPLERWNEYRQKGREILKSSVLSIYENLFELYPDAPFRSDDELRKWFMPPRTSNSRSSVERAIRTFKKLCHLAGMLPKDHKPADTAPLPENDEAQLSTLLQQKPQLVLQIPSLHDKSQYIALFEAIREVFYE
jgi:hypothetical protein